MPVGELVFGNLVDTRVYAAMGREGQPGIYLVSLPGRALPFVAYRAWKVPTGLVAEEFRLVAPSGRVAYRWGPNPRHMLGSMDLTIEDDVIEDALLSEVGTYIASFIVDNEVLGEVEVPVFLQQVPKALPKPVEDGLKRSDVIWVGTASNGRKRGRRKAKKGTKPWDVPTVPAWFVYRQGVILLLSQTTPGPGEQTIPGLPDVPELMIVTRRKGRDTSLDRFYASVRIVPPGPEFEEAAKALADRRRSRFGPPEESITRWRDTCLIAELTPVVPG
jgi:hypothetical protein